MAQPTMALVIAPRRRILHDFKANSGPIVITLAALIGYIILSSLIIRMVERWTFWHAAYFTVINVTTVGFGDVTAVSQIGKLLSGLNAFVGLVAFGVLVALITLAFQPGEFTGTASPTAESLMESPVPPQASEDTRREGATDAASDLLGSLRRILRAERYPDRGRVRISVHHHDDDAHVFIEIFVRVSGDA